MLKWTSTLRVLLQEAGEHNAVRLFVCELCNAQVLCDIVMCLTCELDQFSVVSNRAVLCFDNSPDNGHHIGAVLRRLKGFLHGLESRRAWNASAHFLRTLCHVLGVQEFLGDIGGERFLY